MEAGAEKPEVMPQGKARKGNRSISRNAVILKRALAGSNSHHNHIREVQNELGGDIQKDDTVGDCAQ